MADCVSEMVSSGQSLCDEPHETAEAIEEVKINLSLDT